MNYKQILNVKVMSIFFGCVLIFWFWVAFVAVLGEPTFETVAAKIYIMIMGVSVAAGIGLIIQAFKK